ncbi:GNAT family N-acetyltransferase [Neorhizobium sp. JUb45]|uniref:GNAT family N-acetyltransferase n=1 Tax=Neorhizobium sp. JUb45 TaxID=2485113 RepID=UPI00104E5A3B|nr:GNAT family N-acetyltransferase [Neorhizobium sp. JUb45]TCQ97350.1 acetyltransferase (GNAT) family protein [Neorhizobium sp. JUb45]
MIRLATKTDEPSIKECAEQAYARYVPLIGRKPTPMVADFAAQIDAGEVFVATDDQDQLQGFIVFIVEEEHVLLENVAVVPSAAGQGIGKALISFCEAFARTKNLGSVQLYTNEKMIENLSIYAKLGYTELDRRSEDGFNRVYFEKALN